MKPAARKGDHHACADYGPNMGAQLLVEEGSPNISINGKPAARAGDAVSCRLVVGESPVITEGSASVFFNGRPAARMGDRIEKGGSVSSGSGNVFIGDRGTLVAVGDGIQVAFNDGCGIYLNCPSPADASFKSSLADALAMVEAGRQGASSLVGGSSDVAGNALPAGPDRSSSASVSSSSGIVQCSSEVNLAPPPVAKEQEDKYEYYVVTAEGLKTELAVFSLTQLLFDFSGVQVTDYFEEGRWVALEPDLGEKSKAKINAGKEAYNRQQLRDQSRAAWKGKYQPAKTVSTEVSLPRELTPAATVRAGKASGLAALLSWMQKGGVRENLLDQIQLRHAEVIAKMPSGGGVLIEAHYVLRPMPGEAVSIIVDNIAILGGYQDYVDEIKKQMTLPFIENEYDSASQHEFLFVWAKKK